MQFAVSYLLNASSLSTIHLTAGQPSFSRGGNARGGPSPPRGVPARPSSYRQLTARSTDCGLTRTPAHTRQVPFTKYFKRPTVVYVLLGESCRRSSRGIGSMRWSSVLVPRAEAARPSPPGQSVGLGGKGGEVLGRDQGQLTQSN